MGSSICAKDTLSGVLDSVAKMFPIFVTVMRCGARTSGPSLYPANQAARAFHANLLVKGSLGLRTRKNSV